MHAEEDGKGAEAQAEQEWKDDGSLPLDSQGQLPFYLIDVQEEHSNPGCLYLFGKVCSCSANIPSVTEGMGFGSLGSAVMSVTSLHPPFDVAVLMTAVLG